MSFEHVVEAAVTQRLRDVVPVREMHAAPERQIALYVVDGRVSFDTFGGNSDRDGYAASRRPSQHRRRFQGTGGIDART